MYTQVLMYVTAMHRHIYTFSLRHIGAHMFTHMLMHEAPRKILLDLSPLSTLIMEHCPVLGYGGLEPSWDLEAQAWTLLAAPAPPGLLLPPASQDGQLILMHYGSSGSAP